MAEKEEEAAEKDKQEEKENAKVDELTDKAKKVLEDKKEAESKKEEEANKKTEKEEADKKAAEKKKKEDEAKSKAEVDEAAKKAEEKKAAEAVKEEPFERPTNTFQAYIGAELYNKRMFPHGCPSFQKAFVKLFKIEKGKNGKDRMKLIDSQFFSNRDGFGFMLRDLSKGNYQV